MQYITRKHEFDAGHRVLNERVKCFNLHGHRFFCELTFKFINSKEIGYPIDFKEIKRVGCQFIDDYLDHGYICNPKDELIEPTKKIGSKIWIMSLNENDYCNPTVENVVKEIFMIQEILFEKDEYIKIHKIKLFETPNCWTDCFRESISTREKNNFYAFRYNMIRNYAKAKGVFEYDVSKLMNT